MAERRNPLDICSAADRGLLRIKLELAKERTASFMAEKLEEVQRQEEPLPADRKDRNPKR